MSVLVMCLRKIVVLTVLVLLVSGAVAAQGYSFNGSEPAFLKDIGPQKDRVDNPWAALFVALGVAVVIYIGFRNNESLSRSDDSGHG